MGATGILYVLSMIGLTAVVAVVYSAAQEPFAAPREILRQSLRRGGKLAGVLLALIILVHFLSQFA